MLGPLDAYTSTYTFSHRKNVNVLELADYWHTKGQNPLSFTGRVGSTPTPRTFNYGSKKSSLSVSG
jgi:hypothetical protein